MQGCLPDARILAPLQVRPLPSVHPDLTRLQPVVRNIRPGESVVVVISDQTRKTGCASVLPGLLAGWRQEGIRPADLMLAVACGSHRGPTAAELEALVGGAAVLAGFGGGVQVHDAFRSPCRTLGTTQRGTPVAVNAAVLAARAMVTIGSVTPHYFAGFTGGRKSIVPGLAAAATIAANHSLAIDFAAGGFRAGVELGRLVGNPLAEDLAEAAAFVPVRSAVQTVLDGQGALIGCFAGELGAAHTAACQLARDAFFCPLAEKADIVLASAGPARNWLQSHKALVNASRAVTAGGVIVLMAPCQEGLGSESLCRWLAKGSVAGILAGVREAADINAQTALSTRLRGRQAVLVSEMPAEQVTAMGMTPVATIAQALGTAAARLAGAKARPWRVLPMPEAWLTVPA